MARGLGRPILKSVCQHSKWRNWFVEGLCCFPPILHFSSSAHHQATDKHPLFIYENKKDKTDDESIISYRLFNDPSERLYRIATVSHHNCLIDDYSTEFIWWEKGRRRQGSRYDGSIEYVQEGARNGNKEKETR